MGRDSGHGDGLDRAFFLLDLKPEIVETDHAMSLPAPIREILFERVAFGYDPAQPALKGVDLKAETGTITAIVGGTGSGKSTLMSLLLRLYDPDAGTIRVNGTPLAEIRIESLPDAIEADMLEALATAGALEFVRALPDGIDTVLGRSGDTLSVGQKQRICIARGLIRNTPILILDELGKAAGIGI